MKRQEDSKSPCKSCTILSVIQKKKKIIISVNRPVLLCREQAKGKKA